MAYGWQIFNESGKLVADNSVIMSRRLGTYDIPFIKGSSSGWSTKITANFSGGTPFVHCSVIPNMTVPSDGAWAPIIPDVVISGNTITLSYNWKHFSYPDDLGTALYAGAIRVHYGVYNQ